MLSLIHIWAKNPCGEIVAAACADSFSRLIYPSIEREIRNVLFEDASAQAIKVFSANLRQLLMQPPVKDSVTLGSVSYTHLDVYKRQPSTRVKS